MNASRLRLLAIGLGGSLLVGGVMLACSSEDTVVDTTDGGAESGVDASKDAPVTPEDSGFDGGFQIASFDDRISEALCKSLSRCCFGNPSPADGGLDGGATFNVAKCRNLYKTIGFEASMYGKQNVDGSKLVLDQVAADKCVKGIEGMACNLAGPDLATIRTACFDALQGQGAAGSACKHSIECTKGLFCNVTPDGGLDAGGDAGAASGKCEALRPLDGGCGDFTNDYFVSNEACSWRASGGAYCDFYSDFQNGTIAPNAQWKCKPSVGIGQDCNSDLWCTAAICDTADYKCATPREFFPQSFCATFVQP